jgi:cysteine dioxygenase
MSTHLEAKENISATPSGTSTLSFRGLVECLERQTAPPTLEQLNTWLANACTSREDLLEYIGFKEGNYWRHRVFRNESVEMLVLCWRPGHKTPIHDHNGSHGAVKVYEGVLWETTFVYEKDHGLCYRTMRECKAGEVTGAGVPDIHQLGNPEVSGQDLITIHIYAPPLGVLNTYKVGSPVIDLYIPDDSATVC